MEITRGTNAPLPAHGATIVCLATEELPARMERILEELRAELVPVVRKAGATLDEWTTLGTDLQKTGEQLHQFVARLDGLATGLEQGKGTAGRVLTDTALADEAQQLLARANEAMSELRNVVTNRCGYLLRSRRAIHARAASLHTVLVSNDNALKASKLVHKHPRAGDSGAQLVVVPGVDTVDASEVDTGLMGHSYFGDTRTLLGDLFGLIVNRKPPNKRFGLDPVGPEDARYWRFKPER